MRDIAIQQYAKENPRRNIAVIGLREFEGAVLLTRSRKLPDLWQPVGGGIESRDAAVRELREELGLELNSSMLEEVMVAPYDLGEGTVYFFEAKVDRKELELYADAEEVAEYRWFLESEVGELPALPATQKYLQRIAR